MSKFGLSISTTTTDFADKGGLPLVVNVVVYNINTLNEIDSGSFYCNYPVTNQQSFDYNESNGLLIEWDTLKEKPLDAFSRFYHFLKQYSETQGAFEILAHSPDFELQILKNWFSDLGYSDYTYLFNTLHVNISEIAKLVNSVVLKSIRYKGSFPYMDMRTNLPSVKWQVVEDYHKVSGLMKAESQLKVYVDIMESLVEDFSETLAVHEKPILCPKCSSKTYSLKDGCMLCGV